MPKATQFDLALVRPRPEPGPRKLPPSPLATCPNKVLRMRRLRLYRLVERTQGIIAEIEAELTRRGAKVTGPPRHRGKPVPFRHNELPRLCLNALRAAARPMHVREITALVLTGKDLDPLDRALADATVKRMRDVLLLKRKGVTRLVGLQRARSAKWALVELKWRSYDQETADRQKDHEDPDGLCRIDNCQNQCKGDKGATGRHQCEVGVRQPRPPPSD
jgi:hypothetical protein